MLEKDVTENQRIKSLEFTTLAGAGWGTGVPDQIERRGEIKSKIQYM